MSESPTGKASLGVDEVEMKEVHHDEDRKSADGEEVATPKPDHDVESAKPVRTEVEEVGTEEGKATVELLLMSGKRRRFSFVEETTVAEVKAWVFKNWPEEWHEEMPSSSDSLRLLFMGRFLEDGTSLASNKINNGAATIVHLVIRQPPPLATKSKFSATVRSRKEASNATATNDETTSSGDGCCSSCVIS